MQNYCFFNSFQKGGRSCKWRFETDDEIQRRIRRNDEIDSESLKSIPQMGNSNPLKTKTKTNNVRVHLIHFILIRNWKETSQF